MSQPTYTRPPPETVAAGWPHHATNDVLPYVSTNWQTANPAQHSAVVQHGDAPPFTTSNSGSNTSIVAPIKWSSQQSPPPPPFLPPVTFEQQQATSEYASSLQEELSYSYTGLSSSANEEAHQSHQQPLPDLNTFSDISREILYGLYLSRATEASSSSYTPSLVHLGPPEITLV